jgi:large subunit ribosomal protein L15
MQFHTIKRKSKNKRSVAVGRGGKRGKTSGKGTKGQNARAGRKKRPEMRDRIKQFPKLRGRGKNSNKTIEIKFRPVNLNQIETVFSSGDIVSPKTLVEKGVISKKSGNNPSVKILGDGEITKKVTVMSCAVSKSARAKIEKAGGVIK